MDSASRFRFRSLLNRAAHYHIFPLAGPESINQGCRPAPRASARHTDKLLPMDAGSRQARLQTPLVPLVTVTE